MRSLVALAIGVVALSAGVMLGFKLDDGEPAVTVHEAPPPGVEENRLALLEAAENGDYEALRPLLSDEFRYTFGEPVEGGPIAYWQELEATSDERPLDALAAILRMPYVLSRGYYVWPWAYTVENRADLSAHERGLLVPLGSPDELVVDGTGYLGWRTGIAPDGSWSFFVAGD